MEYRQLGSTDMRISPIGFGSWAVGGGGYAFGWGPQDDRESIAAVHRAIDLGINWLDTAAVYGLGHSEQVVATAVKERGSRARPYVFTKGSQRWNEHGTVYHSLKADSLRYEVEQSLRRLDVEAIDLYQLHWPALPAGAPAPDIEEGWQALADMQREGKLRWIGVSNFYVEHLERVARIAPVSSLQPPYSAIVRRIEDSVLPYCEAHGIGVIVYSPMQAGLLSGSMTRERVASFPADDWRRNDPHFREPALTRNLALADFFSRIGARHGRSAGEVAVAWTLRQRAVTGAIVGFRRPSQVDRIVGAAEFRLSGDEIAEIGKQLPPSQ